MIQNFNKYNMAANQGRNLKDLMILVIEKATNHLRAAKQFLINNEPVELGRHIFSVVQIIEGLSKTITVRDDLENSAEIFKMYETLIYQVENLIAKRAPAEDYDYFISYFEKLKEIWASYGTEAEDQKELATLHVTSFSSIEELKKDIEPVSAFNKEGRFEVVT